MTAAAEDARNGETTMIDQDVMMTVIGVTLGAAVIAMVGMIIVTILRETDAMTDARSETKTNGVVRCRTTDSAPMTTVIGEESAALLSQAAQTNRSAAMMIGVTMDATGPAQTTEMVGLLRKVARNSTKT
jgi:sRNA-binding carbon storage regulator CsrA